MCLFSLHLWMIFLSANFSLSISIESTKFCSDDYRLSLGSCRHMFISLASCRYMFIKIDSLTYLMISSSLSILAEIFIWTCLVIS